jgi:tetratricopeptide (TPR) repeat protein
VLRATATVSSIVVIARPDARGRRRWHAVSQDGRYAAARAAYEESLAIARELGRTKDVAMATSNLGDLMGEQGDLTAGIRLLDQTLATYRTMADKGAIATTLQLRGYELYHHGELAEARRNLEESAQISRAIDQKLTLAAVLTNLSLVVADEGDPATATTLAEEALAIRRAMHVKRREANALLTLAKLAIATRQADVAERDAREVLDGSMKDQIADDQASVHLVLAQAFLLRGNIAAARGAIAKAQAVPAPSIYARLELAPTVARIEASRSPADALTPLRAVVDEATTKGYLKLAFEARLALGEIEMRRGARAAGQAALAALDKDAAAKGFALVARNARNAAR